MSNKRACWPVPQERDVIPPLGGSKPSSQTYIPSLATLPPSLHPFPCNPPPKPTSLPLQPSPQTYIPFRPPLFQTTHFVRCLKDTI
eukprot:349604-Chlamydomonas_euryale.AAC.11